MKNLITCIAIVALTGSVASAYTTITEDFESWTTPSTGMNQNGWTNWLGGTLNFVDSGPGYLGSSGQTHSAASGTINGGLKSLGGLVTSGVHKSNALVNVSDSGNNAWAAVGWREGGSGLYVVVKNGKVEMVASGKPERQVTTAFDALGWFELDLTYDMDGNTATARYRDVDDFGINPAGAWVDLGSFGDAGTPDTNITMDISSAFTATGNTNGGDPGAGRIDNFATYTIPEPASLVLMGLGGLLALSRRRGS